jgi:CRP-like cAMP-binding protein
MSEIQVQRRGFRPHTMTVVRTLDRIPILNALPEPVRRDLEKRCNWREYKTQEQIIGRDSDSRDVYFIVSGAVRVLNFSYSGREVSYDDSGRGGMFGELAAIDGKPRSATVVALRKTLVASLAPDAFKKLIQENPGFALAVIERLTAVIRGATDRIMDLSTLGAYSRVYAEILRLARKAAKGDAENALIEVLPTHSDLGARCGTTRETVARAVSELMKKGVAEKRENGLFVPDLYALQDIVEGGEE